MKKIAITCGDPAGIGPEVIASWLDLNKGRDEDKTPQMVLLGPSIWLQNLGPSPTLEKTPVGPPDYEATPGQPDVDGARVAMEALEKAAQGCRDGRFEAVVTAPTSKEWMKKAGFQFLGHTEFFADRWGGDAVMAFAGGRMKVVLATRHIPLGKVVSHLTEDILKKTMVQAERLARCLGSKLPKIGVCGLNPHAGENGILGTEELEFIDPVLARLRSHIPGLSACQPADTLFWRHLEGDFDVVVALYHDQGLGPLKAVDFRAAVNITLGLPWIRTSTSHGTAFPIAGRGIADPKSIGNAIKMALKLSGSGYCAPTT